MRRPWNQFLRMLDLPRSSLFEDGNALSMQLGGPVPADAMRATQHLVLGACRAAAAALDASGVATDDSLASPPLRADAAPYVPASGNPGVRVEPTGACAVDVVEVGAASAAVAEPLVTVDHDSAARAFATLSNDPASPIDVRALLDTFHPTALLYATEAQARETALLGLRDAARRSTLHGLTAMGEYRGGRRFNALGEALFVPPALRGEVRARSAWIRKQGLDLPSWREAGGPFWRLGRYNLWRLDVLGWPERLALGALVGTQRRVAVLVGPSHLFPRVGFVVETARQMGRTLIGVPLEAAPARLRRAVEESRERLMSRRAQVFMGLEAFL